MNFGVVVVDRVPTMNLPLCAYEVANDVVLLSGMTATPFLLFFALDRLAWMLYEMGLS